MKGLSIMSDGSKYTGQFLKWTTIKDGIGRIIYKDGSLFEGVFKSDDTIKGRYITTKGYVYEGEMKNHKMHGKGKLLYQNKTVYEGDFENGVQIDENLELKTTPSDYSQTDNKNDKTASSKSVQFILN